MSVKTVLLVDDEPQIRTAVEKIIRHSGAPFAIAGTAGSGEEALEFLRSHPVDIAIVDIRMPGMDGMELIQQARELSVRFIVLSAYRDFDYARRALQLGVDDYLLKPLSQEKLLQALDHTARQLEEDSRLHTAARVYTLQQQREAVRTLLRGRTPNQEALPEGLRRRECGSLILLTGEAEFPQPFVEACCQLGWAPFRDAQLAAFLPADRWDTVGAMAELARSLARSYCIEEPVLACSAPTFYTDDLTEALEQCSAAAEFSFYMPSSPVLAYDKIRPYLTAPMQPTLDAFAYVQESVGCGEERVLQRLQEACALLKREMSLPPQIVYQIFNKLLLRLQLSGREEGEKPDIDDLSLQHLHNYSSLSALYQYVTDKIRSGRIGSDRETESIERAKAYCRDHYADSCSLEEIAAAVYLSPSYLSRLFKTRCGISIWNYLTEIRVEKSKKLLANSEAKVSQVGEMVGYQNASHFGRVFRSRTGLSPRAYRLQEKRGIGEEIE